MYQNIFYDKWNNELHLWDDSIGYHVLPYKKYAYKIDDDGSYTTLDGKKVSKILNWKREDTETGEFYEYDIRPEVRTLIDFYYESDEISTNHCIMYLDIEVAKEERYSLPEDANNTITSISYYDSISCVYCCLLLDKDRKISPHQFADVNVETFQTETDLLLRFIEIWNSKPITIVTGWNVLWYDMVYLYNRIEKIIGRFQGNYLSPIRKVENYTNRRDEKVFRIAGISILDYMMLYKKFTYSEQPNYTLGAISELELGRGKVEYDKDLDHLLATDPYKFIEYNVEDVRLVVDLDRKLDFIGVAIGVAHKGHVPYEDVFMTSRYMEGACLTETKRRGIVATQSRIGTMGSDKAAGAFVKRSRPGRYQWVYDLDLTSLYPSNIMSLNISPETKWGKILNWDSYKYIQGQDILYDVVLYNGDVESVVKIPSHNIEKYIRDNNLSVAANGVLYTLDTQGLIPSLLDVWFKEREEYRSLARKFNDAGDKEQEDFYERSQKIQKVLLNSLYGVLLLPIFRFYDKDNGEAVTLTGQQLIQFTTQIANYYYNSELNSVYEFELEDGEVVTLHSMDYVEIERDGQRLLLRVEEVQDTDIYIQIHKEAVYGNGRMSNL